MYVHPGRAHISAKDMQNWKKGVFCFFVFCFCFFFCFVLFLVMLTNFGKNMTDKLRKNMQKCAFSGPFSPGDTQIIFWRGWAAHGLKPLSISKDFSPSKKRLIWPFFFFFSKFLQIGTVNLCFMFYANDNLYEIKAFQTSFFNAFLHF